MVQRFNRCKSTQNNIVIKTLLQLNTLCNFVSLHQAVFIHRAETRWNICYKIYNGKTWKIFGRQNFKKKTCRTEKLSIFCCTTTSMIIVTWSFLGTIWFQRLSGNFGNKNNLYHFSDGPLTCNGILEIIRNNLCGYLEVFPLGVPHNISLDTIFI